METPSFRFPKPGVGCSSQPGCARKYEGFRLLSNVIRRIQFPRRKQTVSTFHTVQPAFKGRPSIHPSTIRQCRITTTGAWSPEKGHTPMKPVSMTEVIDRKRYSTDTATLLAGNDHWDGHNFERHGRNTFLYRGKSGAFFAVHQTCWQGERNHLEPLDVDSAMELYQSLSDRRVEFEEAFPGVDVAEA